MIVPMRPLFMTCSFRWGARWPENLDHYALWSGRTLQKTPVGAGGVRGCAVPDQDGEGCRQAISSESTR
jgi:hypothetical protein